MKVLKFLAQFNLCSVFPILLLCLNSCSLRKTCCNVLKTSGTSNFASSSLKNTDLTYLINYGPDSYDLVANFDVLFITKDTSTNGCTAHIHGKYGELVKSDELVLTGTSSIKSGVFSGTLKSQRKYYLTGIINRPDTEEIRQRNQRALSIHVEEIYSSEYFR